MPDGLQALGWLGVLALGALFCLRARAAGLAVTHVRDLLHLGAGTWVLGWPFWASPALPLAIVWSAAALVLALPALAPRAPALSSFMASVSDGEERWSGIAGYVLSFAILTTLGLVHAPLPAAAALAALALGDGVGGFVGRRFGRRTFRVPGAKRKSWAGSAAVALATFAGILAVAAWLGRGAQPGLAAGGALVAALVEAASPRASDNVLVPAAVWVFFVIAGA